MRERWNKKDRFSSPRRHEDEEIVQNGLSITPERMLEMVQHNIPLNNNNLAVTYDEGYGDLSFDVPLQYQRGVDIGDAWEAQEDVKAKFGKRINEMRADGSFFTSKNE